MTGNFKLFSQIGAVLFLALLVSFVAARAKPFIADRLVQLFSHSAVASTTAGTAKASDSEVDEEDPAMHVSGLSRVYSYGAPDVESDDSPWIVPAITGPITAGEYLVYDLHSGAILENKDIDRVVPMASLTKLVTAEVSRQVMASSTEIDITDAILAAYGSNGHLREGETISAGELLYPLLLVSSNDAAEALYQAMRMAPAARISSVP